MAIFLTADKIRNIVQEAKRLLGKNAVSVRELAGGFYTTTLLSENKKIFFCIAAFRHVYMAPKT